MQDDLRRLGEDRQRRVRDAEARQAEEQKNQGRRGGAEGEEEERRGLLDGLDNLLGRDER